MWYIFSQQILSAEEHLKRQNSGQGMPSRPPLPLQVDTTTDSGSMIRVNTPRTGKEGNPCGDMEGGEADDVSNHNTHSRHLVRTSSSSPSSDSQQRKPVSNTVYIRIISLDSSFSLHSSFTIWELLSNAIAIIKFSR